MFISQILTNCLFNKHVVYFVIVIPSKIYFRPRSSFGCETINRILQTSLRDQLNRFGNVTDKMFEYIDDNKYMVADNREPFIRAKSENSTFDIEDSGLPFGDWICILYRKLQKCSVYIPFTTLEQCQLLNGPIKRKHEIKKEILSNEDDSAIDLDFREIKRQRVNESICILSKLQQNVLLQKSDRLEIMKTIRANAFIEHIDELSNTFSITDGERRINTLSYEQKHCLNSILEYAFPNDFAYNSNNLLDVNTHHPPISQYNPFYKLFLIDGSAGCGKSAIIESLNFYLFTRHKENSQLLYVTQTNVLCQNMRNKCFYNKSMEYMTFFKFLSILDLTYYDKIKLLMNCDALQVDAFQNTCGSDFLSAIKRIVNLLPKPSDDNSDNSIHFFVILDEIYTLSNGKLSLFLFVVRFLKLQNPHLSIYCICIGDKYQLRPFIKLENVKLEVIKQPPGDEEHIEIKSEECKTQLEDDTYIQSLISQSESLENATKFTLTKQYRILDETYNEFIDMVRHCENTEIEGIRILEHVVRLWPQKIDKNLSLKYPILDIIDVLRDIEANDYKKIVITLNKGGLFKRTIDTILFCFTNKHAHYYTFALALSYHNQLSEYRDIINVNDYIAFSIIYNADNLKCIDNETSIGDLINNHNYLVNILPLIRYCPYKILTSACPVARLSIVYLLDWVKDDNKKIITHLVVFSPDTNFIFTLMPSRFQMNVFKSITLFGFPLQLAFSSTYASSQGLTLDNKIAVSCSNISQAELYVCLTRIRKSEDLVRIY